MNSFIMRHKSLIILLLAALTLASCAKISGGATPESRRGYTVAVMLLPCDGMTVDSENPVRVAPGEDAVFSVTVSDDDSELDVLTEGAEYRDGKVIVPSVMMPLTVRVALIPKPAQVIVDPVVTAGPGAPGEPTAKDLTAPRGYFLVVYHANGGTMRAPITTNMTPYGVGTLAAASSAEFYLCPNALADKGYFTRPGYALLGYGTEPDGGGDFYGCGWNIIMPESGVVDLYALWVRESPETDFDFAVTDGKASVTGYRGGEDMVVIPAYYGGVPVVSISPNAFKSACFTKVFLTRGLETVGVGAFSKCDKLTTVYMSDGITSISDASFDKCESLTELYISAVRDPAYTTNKHGTYAVKFELLYTAKELKAMVVCGSNTAYGLDSVQLMNELDFDATVINFGFNWHMPSLIQMEIALRFSNPGDILILAPELTSAQFGGVASYATMWQMLESCYETISYINIKNYTGIFDTFASFNQTRVNMTPRGYDNYVKDVNIYGDYTVNRPAKAEDYCYTGQMNLDFNRAAFFTDERVGRMNAMFEKYLDKGCRVWMSFASINQNSFSPQSKDATYREAWAEAIRSKLRVTMISRLDDYIYPGNYFYDSNFHLSTEATKLRTASLAADMNKAFAALS